MKNNRISRKFNRKTKLIMLVSAITITLLTVGYATFTTSLNIGNTTASIPAGTNNLSSEVVFGNSSITTSGAADAGSVVGTASGQTWNSSTAVFTSSIRSIVFTAPVYNNSAYDVYLTSMQSTSGAKLTCTNGTGDNAASSDLFDNFCNNTKATYSFGGTTVECDVNKCKTTLNSYELVSGGGTANVTLTVSTLSSSTVLPDGQISISIPGITIGFSTTVDTNLSATNYVGDLSTDDATISATVTMAAGLQSFGLSTDSSTEPTSWLTEDDNGTISGTTRNLEYTCNTSGTYYLWIKDVNGNTTKLGPFVIKIKNTVANSIITLSATDTTNLAKDDYDNVRYIGANPDNYACLTSDCTQLFRIIGVFNEDTHGQSGKKLVKLVSADSIGSLSWDYKNNGVGSSERGSGSNDWSDSQLMYMLNGFVNTGYSGTTALHTGYSYNSSTYYISDGTRNIYKLNDGLSYLNGDGLYAALYPPASTSTSGYSYDWKVGIQTLTTTQANMIAPTTWHLGATGNAWSLTSVYYTSERGTSVSSGRPTTWTGKIGLMYASDYGYATSGGSTNNRNTCLQSYTLGGWNSYSDCYTNSWLLYPGARTGTQGTAASQWTLTVPSTASTQYQILSSGYLYAEWTSYGFNVRPSFYLKPETYIASGSGTSTSPYILTNVDSIFNLSSLGMKVTANIVMQDKVSAFGLSTSNSTKPTTWITSDDNGTLSGVSYNLEYTATNAGTYYLWAKDTEGNTIVSNERISLSIAGSQQLINLNVMSIDSHNNDMLLNYRFTGANPDNYACLTSDCTQLFRIIGVFNEDTHGQSGKKLVKLISADSIGSMAWDYKNTDVGSSERGSGSNDWSDSQLMYMLNGFVNTGYSGTTALHTGYSYNSSTYYISDGTRNIFKLNGGLSYLTAGSTSASLYPPASTSTSGYSYDGTISIKTLTTSQANMIASTTWHLGANSSAWSLTSAYYSNERGVSATSGRPTTWSGKIGLMYASDYGYATSGGSTYNRNACLESYTLGDWNSYSDCYTNSWLLYPGSRTNSKSTAASQWTLTVPLTASTQYQILSSGYLYAEWTSYSFYIRPSFYLESDVYISGGTGTSTNPYIFVRN